MARADQFGANGTGVVGLAGLRGRVGAILWRKGRWLGARGEDIEKKEEAETEGERGQWTMGEQTMTLTFGPFPRCFSFFEP